eukprot:TRINITY_DN2383_c0_g1_i2.p1 TRINITY_DN2383_c0_g1~~TRINITY_DN2383_c0_g1_i2.p1  ORF type:complete len:563 (+),score=121.52 TRINITY_DN2383_c0_g1_i2:49-1737(+)
MDEVLSDQSRLEFERKMLSDMTYVRSLCDIFLPLSEPEEKRKDFVILVLDFYEAHKRTLYFLKQLIREEVEKTNHSATILREESHACLFIRHYFRSVVGKRYLHKVLNPFVSQVYHQDRVLQINPAQVGEQEAYRNLKTVLILAESLLETVFGSELACPIGYRQILSYLERQLKNRFPDVDTGIVGAYFFLSYLCPAIIQPHQVDVMPAPPSSATQAGLVCTSKILQNLANKSFFPSTTAFSEPLNQFITNHLPKMSAFLNDLLDREKIRTYKMIVDANRSNTPSRHNNLIATALSNLIKKGRQERLYSSSSTKEVAAYLDKWKKDALNLSDFEKSAEWKQYGSKDGFKFFGVTSQPTSRFVGELPCSMEKFGKFLNSIQAKKIDPLHVEGSVLEKIHDDCYIEHIVLDPGFLFLKHRDVVFFKYHCVFREEILHMLIPVSYSNLADQPYKRIKLEIFWRVRRLTQTSCSVHYMINGSFGAKLAGWVQKGLRKGTLPNLAGRARVVAEQLQKGQDVHLVPALHTSNSFSQLPKVTLSANHSVDFSLDDHSDCNTQSSKKDKV